jgi:hypothetical protein
MGWSTGIAIDLTNSGLGTKPKESHVKTQYSIVVTANATASPAHILDQALACESRRTSFASRSGCRYF